MTGDAAPEFHAWLPNAPNADGVAARAWAMMLEPEVAMPPAAALDWVRDQAGHDDVKWIKAILFDWVGHALGEYGRYRGTGVCVHQWPQPGEPPIGEQTGNAAREACAGRWDAAVSRVAWIGVSPVHRRYTLYRNAVYRVAELGRALAALPE